MFLNPPDAKKYPKCMGLMSRIASDLKTQDKILKAFLDTCKDADQPKDARFVERLAREQALKYGAGPRVDVVEGMLQVPSPEGLVSACGFTNTLGRAINKSNSVTIEMTSFWFNAYEFGYDAKRAGNRLTRTLLHELVHWVRDATGASDSIQVGGYYNGKRWDDAGFLFEDRAYGGNICNADEIFDAMTSYRVGPAPS